MWDNVLGHRGTKEFLSKYLQTEARPHGLLFLGPNGIGKRQLALDFTRTLLCLEGKGEGCRCESCRLFNPQEGNFAHQDFVRLAIQEGKKNILIEQVKELIGKSAYAPVLSRYKVLLVEDADRMTRDAANSFLKLLEEPPANWTIILLAESEERLLPTILSRVVKLRMQPIPKVELEKALLLRGIKKEEARLLAGLSDGSLGLALDYHEQEALTYRREAYAFIEALPLAAPLVYLSGRVWQNKYDREDSLLFLQLLQLLLRDMLLLKAGLENQLYNEDMQVELAEENAKWSLGKLKQALELVQDAYTAIMGNAGFKLALEAMALKIDYLIKE